jgi:nucleotide-binding universal stress UspA family protein
MTDFKSALVPIDFSESSEQALEVAIGLTERYGASLTLLHVCEPPVYGYPGMAIGAVDLLTPIQDAAKVQLETALEKLKKRVPGAKSILRVGVPWQEILSGAEETKADLIVMGTHGRRFIQHALLGSVAERVVRLSPVPVLTVRAKAKP